MIGSREWPADSARPQSRLRLGPVGHGSLLVASVASPFLVAESRTWLGALLALAALGLVYPHAVRRALRPRWLLLIGVMILPSLLLPGEPAVTLGRWQLSQAGVVTAHRAALRALVILVAVDGLTSTFDIVEISRVFERIGFKGMGFALGVAFNLLPIVGHSASTTWHSLRMRGGLRRRPLHGLRCYIVTVSSCAIQRAGDIALAAEARAFKPGKYRPVELRLGPWDGLICVASAAILAALCWA